MGGLGKGGQLLFNCSITRKNERPRNPLKNPASAGKQDDAHQRGAARGVRYGGRGGLRSSVRSLRRANGAYSQHAPRRPQTCGRDERRAPRCYCRTPQASFFWLERAGDHSYESYGVVERATAARDHRAAGSPRGGRHIPCRCHRSPPGLLPFSAVPRVDARFGR